MKTIHIFDMDDTLLVTPTFADMIGRGDPRLNDAMKAIREMFMLFVSKEVGFDVMGDFIVLMDVQKRRPMASHALMIAREKLDDAAMQMKPEAFKKQYGIKFSSVKDALKMLSDKDGVVVISQVTGFHANPDTIGHIMNRELESAYRGAEHKMILTGRGTDLLFSIAQRLRWIGLEYPDQGLHCFPKAGHKKIEDFKVSAILRTIEENGWEEVHFYEDRKDWLNSAKEAVQRAYPSVIFIDHHISNVHDSRTL